MIKLTKGNQTLKINSLGAEIVSYKKSGIELMEHSFSHWGKVAPLLFPFIGVTNNGTYSYQGKTYKAERHGVVRSKLFNIVETTSNSVTLFCKIDYYLPLSLRVKYTLKLDALFCEFEVINENSQNVHFKFGWHPAFKIFESISNYWFETDTKEYIELLDGGLITRNNYELNYKNSLDKKLYGKDTLVWESNICKLSSKNHNVIVKTLGFNYFGLWYPKNEDVDFVCIEPWTYASDLVGEVEDITRKNNYIVKANDTLKLEATVNVEIKSK